MERPSSVAQQGALHCQLELEHEQRLTMFLNGLKNDPKWTESQIDRIEDKFRQLLQSDLGDGNAVLSNREEETLRLIAIGNTN